MSNKKLSTRVERKRAKARELALDTAIEMIVVNDFFNLNMSDLAKEIDISVGALYQIFPCKEEVLMAIAIRGARNLYKLLLNASTVNGLTREQMTAIHLAHNYFTINRNVEYESAYLVKMDGVSQKISPENHLELECILGDILNVISDVARRAVKLGELVLPEGLTAENILYNFWSLHYGNYAVAKFDLFKNNPDMDKALVQRLYFRQMLNGLNWKPLSSEFDYVASAQRIAIELGLHC